jgi:PKD repeat protein
VRGGSGTITSYAWTLGDGSYASGLSVTHSYASAGSYVVVLSVTDSNGDTASTRVTLTISSLTVNASFSPTTALPGDLVSFTATAAGGAGPPYTYLWDFGDSQYAAGDTASHNYSTGGTYEIAVTVTDGSGATHSSVLGNLSVRYLLSASITVSVVAPTVGEAVGLSAVVSGGSGGTTCSWSFGDASEARGCTTTHAWAAPGVYTVAVIVVDSSGDSIASSAPVSVASLPTSSEPPSVFGPSVGGVPALGWIAAAAVAAVVVALLLPRRGRRHRSAPDPPTAQSPPSGDT